MNKSFYLLSVILIIFLSSFLSAQSVGKILNSSEANSTFGEVLESKSILTVTVQGWLNSTDDKIMFRLENGNLFVLGDDRELLYSSGSFTDNNQLFHLYSKSKVSELITMGSDDATYFENRADVFTLTNGNFTLEYAWPCPPYCD